MGKYQAQATYDSSGIEILDVREGDPPLDTPVFNINPGITDFSQDIQPAGGDPPISVARLIPRLIGNATTQYTIDLQFTNIEDPTGGPLPTGGNVSTYQRGDAQGPPDGDVDMLDAMFAAQYAMLARAIDDLNQVNAASVCYDGASGDKILMTDAMFIAQYAMGVRDADFNLLP